MHTYNAHLLDECTHARAADRSAAAQHHLAVKREALRLVAELAPEVEEGFAKLSCSSVTERLRATVAANMKPQQLTQSVPVLFGQVMAESGQTPPSVRMHSAREAGKQVGSGLCYDAKGREAILAAVSRMIREMDTEGGVGV